MAYGAHQVINIQKMQEKVPGPDWVCSVQHEGPQGLCLEPDIRDGYIVSGQEYRMTECWWGGKVCNDYLNEVEWHPYCLGSNTQICPLNPQGFDIFRVFKVLGKNRLLRASPPDCLSEVDVVTQCDLDLNWSRWLRWESMTEMFGALERQRRRYCHQINHDCLFEEMVKDCCCIDITAACSYDSFCPNQL